MQTADLPSLFNVTEVELIYRNKVKPENRIKISSSLQAYQVLKNTWDENRIELLEQFKIILLDFRLNVLGIADISTGGVSSCPMDLKIIFATALKARASKIIAAHNHPSGCPLPGREDIECTRRLVNAGKLLDIAVDDHIIVTQYGYYSFVDSGTMPGFY